MKRFDVCFICWITLESFITASAQGFGGDDTNFRNVIEKTIEQQELKQNELKNMKFFGTSIFQEMDSNGKVIREIMVERVIYEAHDEQVSRYLFMVVNGDSLNKNEMNKQIKQWENVGKKRGTTKMPFDPAFVADYEYQMCGIDTLAGYRVWVIDFKPHVKEDGYIEGTSWITQRDYQVLKIDASPIDRPLFVQKIQMIYTYAPEQGYWLPAMFELNVRVKVRFIVTLADRRFTLADSYHGYQFNIALADSIFEDTE